MVEIQQIIATSLYNGVANTCCDHIVPGRMQVPILGMRALQCDTRAPPLYRWNVRTWGETGRSDAMLALSSNERDENSSKMSREVH